MTADAVHAHHKPSFLEYITGVAARINLSRHEIETAEIDYAAGYMAGQADGFKAGFAAGQGVGT